MFCGFAILFGTFLGTDIAQIFTYSIPSVAKYVCIDRNKNITMSTEFTLNPVYKRGHKNRSLLKSMFVCTGGLTGKGGQD